VYHETSKQATPASRKHIFTNLDPQILTGKPDNHLFVQHGIDEFLNFGYCEFQNSQKDSMMRQALIVSNRGQLTLPASMRKRFGIKDGGVVILEERDNELVLKPAMVLEVDTYTDAQISEWDEADRLEDTERKQIRSRLGPPA